MCVLLGTQKNVCISWYSVVVSVCLHVPVQWSDDDVYLEGRNWLQEKYSSKSDSCVFENTVNTFEC